MSTEEKQDCGPLALKSNLVLGPLPEARWKWAGNGPRPYEDAYSADQMRAYAAEQVAGELRRWMKTVQHAATELAELDDETAQVQAAALMRLCGPNVGSNARP
jgi:uncharacterized protein YukE